MRWLPLKAWFLGWWAALEQERVSPSWAGLVPRDYDLSSITTQEKTSLVKNCLPPFHRVIGYQVWDLWPQSVSCAHPI